MFFHLQSVIHFLQIVDIPETLGELTNRWFRLVDAWLQFAVAHGTHKLWFQFVKPFQPGLIAATVLEEMCIARMIT